MLGPGLKLDIQKVQERTVEELLQEQVSYNQGNPYSVDIVLAWMIARILLPGHSQATMKIC